MTLIDSNVLIDIFERDEKWWRHSVAALSERARQGPIAINDIIYAELAAGFENRQALDREIDAIGLSIERLSRQAGFLAGRAFRRHRAAGGVRSHVLADFFVGAHASAEGWPILTRDARRYRTHFPDVEVLGVGD